MYIVLHSTDPYPLARASMELQMAGVGFDDWNRWLDISPFSEINRDKLSINHPECPKNSFTFWAVKLSDRGQINYTLTSRNYTKIMEKIINSICQER